jgi:hypothetical protein
MARGGALDEQEWQRIRDQSAPVDDVEADAADRDAELVECVELRFLRPPVEAAPPVLDQAGHEVTVRPVPPAGARHLVGPAGAGQTLAGAARSRRS